MTRNPRRKENNETPKNKKQLRYQRETLGLGASADALLVRFQGTRSAKRRGQTWNALLELLSVDDGTLSEVLRTQWSDALVNALTDSDREIRCQSLSALKDVAPHVMTRTDVIQGIVQCLYDRLEQVRSQAIYSASSFRSHLLVKSIADSLVNADTPAMSNDPAKRRLWHALFALDSVMETIELTLAERNLVAFQVFAALCKIMNEPSASDLDIWKIGESLGEHVKGDAAMGFLGEMLIHDDPRVRDSALHGLGHLGGSKAIELIKQGLFDPVAEVREEARKALLECDA